MATRASSPPPIIIEPASSPRAPPPDSLANLSPDTNSSSDSNNYSSRPQSQYSSDTSQSEAPSPIEYQSCTPDATNSPNDIELSSLAPPVLTPPTTNATPPADPFISPNDPPRSVPSPSLSNISHGTVGTQNSNQVSWFRKIWAKIHEKRWLENTIGVLGVAVAIWLGVRGYKLAVWQSWNDLRQTCASYKQVGSSKKEPIVPCSQSYRSVFPWVPGV